jgi:hypothetical protein
MNATEHAGTFTVSVQGLEGLNLVTQPTLDVPATGIGSLPVRLALTSMAAKGYRGKVLPIRFTVHGLDADRVVAVEEKTTFVIPR